MRVQVVEHPLIAHKLTQMRRAETSSNHFRQLTGELVTLLSYEASATIATEPVTITTPMTEAQGTQLAGPTPLVVPILRAGLGMLEGMTAMIPTAEVGFLGMARNEETLDIITYAERLPDDLTGRHVFVLDPMLATGGTLAESIRFLTQRNAARVSCICLLAAPEGIERLEREVGDIDVELFLGAIDEGLDENAYIVPGLGDAGDRLYGLTE
ncbi:uracil phosphoribosyltransferase [Nesterenkonia marinintestina]|uniref:uracil phosphoribosyltransferase n=1 Tax=Nesterenkonia marinintestina TaxID=2979865 RepID=UPI0021C1E20C|nr:uracil phosphoribosyltransferase [Nesterenkonia sp. GX14115]